MWFIKPSWVRLFFGASCVCVRNVCDRSSRDASVQRALRFSPSTSHVISSSSSLSSVAEAVNTDLHVSRTQLTVTTAGKGRLSPLSSLRWCNSWDCFSSWFFKWIFQKNEMYWMAGIQINHMHWIINMMMMMIIIIIIRGRRTRKEIVTWCDGTGQLFFVILKSLLKQ